MSTYIYTLMSTFYPHPHKATTQARRTLEDAHQYEVDGDGNNLTYLSVKMMLVTAGDALQHLFETTAIASAFNKLSS